jgi:hypothetical protein
MKRKKGMGVIFVFMLAVVIVSCDNPVGGTDNNPGNPSSTPLVVTYTVMLENLYAELINRIGIISSDSYTGPTGDEMGEIANCQYICNAINAYANKDFQPVPGYELQVANMEYLLKMVDKVNSNSTSYGTGEYATKQVVDTVAVTRALDLVILFQTQTWSTTGTYQIELPAGTYKMTAVSGRGGRGGNGVGSYSTGGAAGGYGVKITQIFTIPSTVTVVVVVAGHGSLGGNGGSGGYGNGGNGGKGGNSSRPGWAFSGGGGGGGGGASGIIGYFYARGGIGGNGGGGDDPGASPGNGGSGGTLTGTAVTETTTTENPYVTIERS